MSPDLDLVLERERVVGARNESIAWRQRDVGRRRFRLQRPRVDVLRDERQRAEITRDEEHQRGCDELTGRPAG